MCTFWVIAATIAIFLVVKPVRVWIESNYKFWQAIAALGTVFVLFIGFNSLNQTRELFKLQNQPYIGVSKLTERNHYSAETRNISFKTKVFLYNSGNMPGEIRSIKVILSYQDIQIESTNDLKRMIYPNDISDFILPFTGEQIKLFEDNIYSEYKPSSGWDYINNLKFEFEINYFCYPLDEDYRHSSTWQHYGDCDRYIQVN